MFDHEQFLSAITTREWFLIIICAVIYLTLFIVAIQNSRRKVLLLQERMEKLRQIQAAQHATSMQNVEVNKKKIIELQELIKKLGSENNMLRLELEEKKVKLDYSNTMAEIENEKRNQADTIIFSSPIYQHLQELVGGGRSMNNSDLAQLDKLVNFVYEGFTSKLFGLYKMTSQEHVVCLLIKTRFAPKDIAVLTAHSKESIASTRSRLYLKIFGEKGSTKDWDDFILSL